MSNRTDPAEDLSTNHGNLPDEQPSLEEPARPAIVASGMFLPALIILAIAIVVIVFFAVR
jgi:hypothetical protein